MEKRAEKDNKEIHSLPVLTDVFEGDQVTEAVRRGTCCRVWTG
jgi:molybdopterin biosynthesis enzyme